MPCIDRVGNAEVAACPFAPRAGRRWRQPDEGQAAIRPACSTPKLTPRSVLLGLDPRIHSRLRQPWAWIPGSRPGMTEVGAALARPPRTPLQRSIRRGTQWSLSSSKARGCRFDRGKGGVHCMPHDAGSAKLLRALCREHTNPQECRAGRSTAALYQNV
ncbi:hypothetical protein GFL58_16530 [Rhizobium leguminosarum bv. viciae]|nr:hypothetical protein [Rhizobium leguminosarum bv. viciae]